MIFVDDQQLIMITINEKQNYLKCCNKGEHEQFINSNTIMWPWSEIKWKIVNH